ncbi:glycosyltransferase family protein [Desertimonas flava]|uniref:glycosyltransferase family protein n=1 Tax=Desertimonas flava TaxID=2064846 RepID=UPI000E34656C|nr:hypothetical protein [Desertimonas flava]
MRPRALLITPSFFGYEKDIVAEFERQGFDVTLIDERPSNSSLVRAAIRWSRQSLKYLIDRYYLEQHRRIEGLAFDTVVVVKGEAVPRWFLEALRSQTSQARWIYYTFDSIANNPNSVEILDLFDVRFSFDPNDVAQRADLTYLPLFYTSDFETGGVRQPSSRPATRRPRWDVCFVGTLHSDRYPIVSAACPEGADAFVHLFVQARWYFAVTKYVTREHTNVSWSQVSTTSLPRDVIAARFRESHAVLDIPRTDQAGLTMRTFETLATGAILVTTNQFIRHEPFYDPSRVVLIERDADGIDGAKLQEQLAALTRPVGPPANFDDYSLANWVSRLTSDTVVERFDRRLVS